MLPNDSVVVGTDLPKVALKVAHGVGSRGEGLVADGAGVGWGLQSRQEI